MHHVSREGQAVLELARREARRTGLGYIGTEHLLLGLLQDEQGLAGQALVDLGIDEYQAREQLDQLLKERLAETWVLGRLPGTPHFRDVLTRAAAEAKGSGNWQIRSEHLLLALLADTSSIGSRALGALGATTEAVRRALGRRRSPEPALGNALKTLN